MKKSHFLKEAIHFYHRLTPMEIKWAFITLVALTFLYAFRRFTENSRNLEAELDQRIGTTGTKTVSENGKSRSIEYPISPNKRIIRKFKNTFPWIEIDEAWIKPAPGKNLIEEDIVIVLTRTYPSYEWISKGINRKGFNVFKARRRL